MSTTSQPIRIKHANVFGGSCLAVVTTITRTTTPLVDTASYRQLSCASLQHLLLTKSHYYGLLLLCVLLLLLLLLSYNPLLRGWPAVDPLLRGWPTVLYSEDVQHPAGPPGWPCCFHEEETPGGRYWEVGSFSSIFLKSKVFNGW